jgi:hypothetical protein
MDNDGTDELISIELLQDGKKELTAYKWKGFGVELMNSSDKFGSINEIETVNDGSGKKIIVKANRDSKWTWYTVLYNEGKIFMKEGNSF